MTSIALWIFLEAPCQHFIPENATALTNILKISRCLLRIGQWPMLACSCLEQEQDVLRLLFEVWIFFHPFCRAQVKIYDVTDAVQVGFHFVMFSHLFLFLFLGHQKHRIQLTNIMKKCICVLAGKNPNLIIHVLHGEHFMNKS